MARLKRQACFKTEAFEEEREWRVVQFIHPSVNNPKVHFRASQGGIVPYLELFGPESPQTQPQPVLPIEEVIFGPTLDSTVAEEVLTLLFAKRGYASVKVTKSSVPFRL